MVVLENRGPTRIHGLTVRPGKTRRYELSTRVSSAPVLRSPPRPPSQTLPVGVSPGRRPLRRRQRTEHRRRRRSRSAADAAAAAADDDAAAVRLPSAQSKRQRSHSTLDFLDALAYGSRHIVQGLLDAIDRLGLVLRRARHGARHVLGRARARHGARHDGMHLLGRGAAVMCIVDASGGRHRDASLTLGVATPAPPKRKGAHLWGKGAMMSTCMQGGNRPRAAQTKRSSQGEPKRSAIMAPHALSLTLRAQLPSPPPPPLATMAAPCCFACTCCLACT